MKKYISRSYITSVIICLFSSVFFVSCEKEIVVDLNSSPPKVVIEALLPLDSLAKVKITQSQDYNQEGGFSVIKGAVVTLSDNVGNVEILEHYGNGLYCSKIIKGVERQTYNLSVVIDGKNYTSVSTMPQQVKIDSLYIYYVPAIEMPYPMVQFTDIPGEKNYYRTVLYVNGKRIRLAVDVTDDLDRDGTVIDFLQTYNKDDNNGEKIKPGDLVTVDLQCVDEGAYTYFETLGRIQTTLNNPTSNIKGGALGYFSAYTSDKKSIIAEW